MKTAHWGRLVFWIVVASLLLTGMAERGVPPQVAQACGMVAGQPVQPACYQQEWWWKGPG